MKRVASVLIALGILVVSGLVHGFWAERWTPSTALQEAAARVEQVSMAIGDWQAQAIDTDPGAFFQAGAVTYWTRSYTHARTKTSVLAILMCGRAGRMSVHTPELCYRGAGYDLTGEPEKLALKSISGTDLGSFWTARFTKQAGSASDLRLAWAWKAGGTWQAPSNPRWEFAGEPFLYKLYLSTEAPAAASQEAIKDFSRQFLPELHRVLFVAD